MPGLGEKHLDLAQRRWTWAKAGLGSGRKRMARACARLLHKTWPGGVCPGRPARLPRVCAALGFPGLLCRVGEGRPTTKANQAPSRQPNPHCTRIDSESTRSRAREQAHPTTPQQNHHRPQTTAKPQQNHAKPLVARGGVSPLREGHGIDSISTSCGDDRRSARSCRS